MAHEKIFQVDFKPIKHDDFINEDECAELFHDFFANWYEDVLDNVDIRKNIKNLAERLNGEIVKGRRICVKKNILLDQLKREYEQFLTAVKELETVTFDEYEEAYCPKLKEVNNLYDEQYGFYFQVADNEYLISADKLIRHIISKMERDGKDQISLYVGAVIDYHY